MAPNASFQIEAVDGFTFVEGKELYLIKWKDTDKRTWEPYAYVQSDPMVQSKRRKIYRMEGVCAGNSESETESDEALPNPTWIVQAPPTVRIMIDQHRTGLQSLVRDLTYVDKNVLTTEVLMSLRTPMNNPDMNECPCASGDQYYTSRGLLLSPETVRVIRECNSRCSCSQKCKNRVVQNGSHIKVEIYYSGPNCGWGVRTLEKISKGSFVVEYTGEVITTEVANKRRHEDETKTYLFDLDGCTDETAEFTIDACYFGNYSRFLNHCCDPNMKVITVSIEETDIRLHRLAFFALRDIQKHEDLTFDYSGGYDKPGSGTKWLKCMCKARSCRKFVAL